MADAAEAATQAYVWAWLPDAVDPVLAGRIDREGPLHTFTYGRSYLAREQAMPLYLPELPLVERIIQPLTGEIAGCLRDASPDGWGQRVIENAHVSAGGTHALGVLDCLVRSSANRIGALGFSRSVDAPPSSGERGASLDELVASAERVEAGEPLDPDLDRALLHGTSVGGARPKALLSDGDRSLIAKFSSSSDSRPVVKAEFVAMTLAKRAGLTVAPVGLVAVQHRDVLLVERFDRTPDGGRRALVSALTVLGLDELGGRYATYWELADSIRARFTDPDLTLRELFSRITFNVLVGNTDDHPRNHAAFWDGRSLSLTPAYDLCPQPRIGRETAQAMAIAPDGFRRSELAGCIERAGTYHLDAAEARSIVHQQIDTIAANWAEVCDAARLTEVERMSLWEREFMNPSVLAGL
jgi:serine/threonine-protein kinase HipA